MKDKNKKYSAELTQHINSTRINKLYAIKRIDIVLITLSSAGIYFNFEFFKFIQEYNKVIDCKSCVLIPSLFFSSTIVLNIISHWTGYFANKYEEICSGLELDKLKRRKIDKEYEKRVESRIQLFNKFTSILNGITSILLVISIIIFIVIAFAIF